MGAFKDLRAKAMPPEGSAPPASTTITATPPPPKRGLAALNGGKKAEAEAPVEAAAPKAAPWADLECLGCETNDVRGFNSKGNPCRACTNTSPSRMGILESCEVTGPFEWKEKSKIVVKQEAPADATPTEPATRKAVKKASEEQPHQTPEEIMKPQEPAKPLTDTPASPPPTEPDDAEEKGKRGRKKKFFSLLLGCTTTKSDSRSIYFVEDIFAAVKAKICQERGVETFWDLDPFRRKDLLCFAAEQIAEDLGTGIVIAVASGGSVDLKVFIDALKPYASTIVQGVIS